MARTKTPRDAKGATDLKLIERTSASVFKARIPPRSLRNLKHCHTLICSRDVLRIDKQPWEDRVAEILRLHEKHRYEQANALHHALQRIQGLLVSAQERERALKATTDELETTSTYVQTLIDSMAEILIATSTAGVITEANKAAQRIAGYHREDLIGAPFVTLFADRDLAGKGISRVLRDHLLKDYELLMISENGQRIPVMLNATVLLDAEGEVAGLLITLRDVSELKRAQRELELHAKELARANEDLEEFASIASHDLQDPLSRVSLFARRLAERFKDETDQGLQRDVAFIIDQAAQMKALINSVLEYAKVGAAQAAFEPVCCEDLFFRVVDNLGSAIAEAGVVLRHDPLPTLMGDQQDLYRVFQNLIGNAVKYSDQDKDERWIYVGAVRTQESGKGAWRFTVADNGIGIDSDFSDDIFKMFVRLHSHSEIQGSGMGLAIVWKILHRLGGSIRLESEEGEGSSFVFTIPDQ